MNLLDRKQQEEFFLDHLRMALPQKHGIRIAASSYEEEWSAMRYTTPAGPLIVRINDIQKPETDVGHRTGFVARLLSEAGGRDPEEYIKSAKGLFDGIHANFDTPIICPGGAEVFAWDSTRKKWPRPFYIRRWVEGPNLAVAPQSRLFPPGRGGAAPVPSCQVQKRTTRISGPLQKERVPPRRSC